MALHTDGRHPATPGRCPEGRDADLPGAACRRKPGGDARPRSRQDASGLYSIGAFEPIKAVIYDFADSRAGKHAQEFLDTWRGTLVCDDYAGYKALIADGVTEAGCMAHARRKFFDLHASNQSQIAEQALAYIQGLYQVEREVAERSPDERRRIRQAQAKPILDEFHDWLPRH